MNIAITGSGIVSAIGNNKAEVLDSLRSERTGVGRMQYLPSVHTELPVGEVKMSNEEMCEQLGIPVEDYPVSRTTLLGALAVRQAMAEADIDASASEAGRKVAFISGTTVGGMDITERYFQQMKTDESLRSLILHHDCGACTDDIAAILNLKTENITISTACSSALNSIIIGTEMLKTGEADMVIAGGTEALSLFHLNGFNSLMILDHELCRPFDATRQGLNLGEGAAYVVLEREDDAQQRGANVQAYVAGYGNRCDAFHQTATSADGEGAYLAMNDALAMAGLKSSDIDYVNAHGTGTPNNDSSESAALVRIFGNNMPPVSSTKAYTGHTTSASGSIETVICLLAMQYGFLPANLAWKNQMEDGITPTLGAEGVTLRNIVCNSFGFGGNDSSMVITKEPQAPLWGDKRGSSGAVVVSDVVIDNVEALKDSRDVISPMEGRRMGKLLKAATMTSMRALNAAGVDCPDAIITATALGMLDNSERFLESMTLDGEEALSPTQFMQSTHNTLSSAIAIRTKCHGYNITYTHGARSLDQALADARRLIATGKARTVLVGCHDESTEIYREYMKNLGHTVPLELYSRSIVLTASQP